MILVPLSDSDEIARVPHHPTTQYTAEIDVFLTKAISESWHLITAPLAIYSPSFAGNTSKFGGPLTLHRSLE